MTLSIDPSTVKRGLSAHAALGLIGGALLYLVCLTGTVLVLYEEWQRFEQPDAPEMSEISPAAVQRAVESVLAAEDEPTTHLYVHMPTAELPRTTITTDTQAVHIDAGGSAVLPEENAWSEFLYALHYTLNLPMIVGITIVGLLGAMMLALAITGVIALPRIFRDAFRLRSRKTGGIAMADWHNRLSVWTLPFTLAIGLTGAAIGLAIASAYGVAMASYDGDTDALFASLFGDEPEMASATSTAVPDVAGVLNYMSDTYPEVEVTYAILHDPGTTGQHVQIVGEHSRRLIFGEYYNFTADGAIVGTAGLSDGSPGQQAAASTYNLHFGNYGGLIVKIAYIAFGLAMTVVCATGTFIWLGKRRRRGIQEPRLRAAWHGVVWGAPAALGLTLIVRLAGGNDAPFAAIFWIGLSLSVAIAAWRAKSFGTGTRDSEFSTAPIKTGA
ncbi:PepSY-associated TM helix domain-containing protein [Aurantiacibacter rhizosphaerae]|uniref:PepSY domain-containing protein n=1 Tax=Aurantiacibacter rhizosphaerae TaxID=2691582 RepID=A0A844X9M9_9SPHN|nr:PepSY-associated TM helix domain-containing protein [Aurantiacibacter rhizosphaerae]MWV26384.1 PepSY domain-containing protein [Aurantiacibacter rhizosphaerae]